jgi:hypothetical protein
MEQPSKNMHISQVTMLTYTKVQPPVSMAFQVLKKWLKATQVAPAKNVHVSWGPPKL